MSDDPMPVSPADPPNLAKATEHLWRTLQTINEWTRFADAKAAAVLTADGVLIGLAAGLLKDHWEPLKTHRFILLVAIVGIVAMIVSSIGCVMCIIPKLTVKGGTGSGSRLFFDHIAQNDQATYLASAIDLADDERAFREVATQVWANAKVAREKHREVALAIRFTIASLVCCLFACIAFVVS